MCIRRRALACEAGRRRPEVAISKVGRGGAGSPISSAAKRLQLAEDAARVRADGLDADLQRERDLRVGATFAQQHQHIALTAGEQRIENVTASLLAADRHELQAARGEVDRVADVARLGVSREARAGAEGQQLSRLGSRRHVTEQHQARRRVLDAQRADRGEIGQPRHPG